MTDVSQRLDLPVGSIGRHANGWWGMMMLIVTEGALFVYLLFAYYYAAVQHQRNWLPEDLPDFRLSLPDTILLLLSSVVVWRGESLIKQGRSGADGSLSQRRSADGNRLRRDPGAGMGHEEIHAVLKLLRIALLHHHRLSHGSCRRGRSYPATLALWCALGYFNRIRSAPVSIGAIYWHFVDAVWLAAVLHLLRHATAGARVSP